MKKRALAISILCALTLVPASVEAQSSRGIRVRSMPTADYVGMPRTLDGILNSGQFLAVVKLGQRSFDVVERDGERGIVTRFSAEVVEVMRNEPNHLILRGQTVQVLQRGGIVTIDGEQVDFRDNAQPRYVPGMEMLVALQWSEFYQGYFPTYGPNSAFELDRKNDQVRSQGRLPDLSNVRGRRVAEFLADVRRRVR